MFKKVNNSKTSDLERAIKGGEKYFYTDYVYGVKLNWPVVRESATKRGLIIPVDRKSPTNSNRNFVPEFSLSSAKENFMLLEYLDEGDYKGHFMSVLTGEIVLFPNFILADHYDGKMDPENFAEFDEEAVNLILCLGKKPNISSYPWLRYVKRTYDAIVTNPIVVCESNLRPLSGLTMAEQARILEKTAVSRDERRAEVLRTYEDCYKDITSGAGIYDEITKLCEENKDQDVTEEFNDFYQNLSVKSKILRNIYHKRSMNYDD